MWVVSHVMCVWVSEVSACQTIKQTPNKENQSACPRDSMLLSLQEERERRTHPAPYIAIATPTRGVTKPL